MKNLNDIEELFSKSFENFEQEVNPSVWTNVQQAIQTPASPPAPNASVAGKGIALKYAAVAIISVATVTGAYFIAKEFNENKKEKQSTLTVAEESNSVVENKTNIETETKSDLDKNSLEILPEKKTIQTNSTETKTENETNNEIKINANSEKENTSVNTKPESVSENNTVTAEKNKQNAEQKEQVKENTKETEVVATFEIDVEVNVLEDYDNKTIAFSIENEVEKVEWKFGDNSVSTSLNGLHRYNSFGKYVVEVTAWLKNGQKKTSKKQINLQLKSGINFIPNVITPNNDGSNDVFEVKVSNMESFQIVIVDRTGKLVFESFNPQIIWNGNDLNGTPCSNGTYAYVIKAIGTDKETHNTNGTIQLLR